MTTTRYHTKPTRRQISGRGFVPIWTPTPPRSRRRVGFFEYQEFTQTYVDSFRVADDSLSVYQLFVGEDQEPDLHGPPVAESASLPFSWTPTPPTSGNKTLYCVVRKKNEYGLTSFNVKSFRIQIDSGGSQVLLDPSAPIDIDVEDDIESGKIRVFARYLADQDPNPADTWEVFVAVGTDPDLGRSSGPDISKSMVIVGGILAELTVTIGTFTPGDTVHVQVLANRSSDDAYGAADVFEFTLGETIDLSSGSQLGGSVYEQK